MRASLVLCCVCLPSLGCGLIPVPYATEVTGPVRGIRVVDAATGADIPGASAALDSGLGMSEWRGRRPPQLLVAATDAAEDKRPAVGKDLRRREDQTFAVPRQVQLGLVALRYWRQSPPTATIKVSAPGYPQATLEYCTGQAPQIGWSDSRRLMDSGGPQVDPSAASPPADQNEVAHCEVRKGGLLEFRLRRLTPEMVAALQSPGRPPDPASPADSTQWTSAEEPAGIEGQHSRWPAEVPEADAEPPVDASMRR